MAEIINLRQHRKRKARIQKEAEAAEKRALHGLTKTERERLSAQRKLDARRLDEHRRSESGDE
jgi:uncharacterized protein DUF4169